MRFNRIEMETWKRKNLFLHFIREVKCVMALNADIDVTDLVRRCKQTHHRFYPVYIYLTAKVVNNHEEFRMGFDENGDVGIWDSVDPSYIVFHPEDESFTRLITGFNLDFKIFYKEVIHDMEDHECKRGLEIPYPNKNYFDVSCLPWISYHSFDMHIYDEGTYLAPVITWGKYEKKGDQIVMPLTLQIHHAAADGFHAARFFAELEEEGRRLGEALLK